MRELESYELVVLRRPANPPPYDEPTLARLQVEHLEFRDRLREEGVLALNGPVVNQPDEQLRGFCLFRTGSLEQARQISEQDPLFLAGRLEYDVMNFWCVPGTLTMSGQPFTLG